jgi:hypothetical protein
MGVPALAERTSLEDTSLEDTLGQLCFVDRIDDCPTHRVMRAGINATKTQSRRALGAWLPPTFGKSLNSFL